MSLAPGPEGWMDQRRRWLLSVWLLGLFVFAADQGGTHVIRQDAQGYYFYLPAFAFGEWNAERWHFLGTVDRNPETGHLHTKYTYGTALLQAPFFAAAHVVAGLTGAERNGISMPYKLGIVFCGAFYLVLGCGLLYAFLRSRVGFGTAILVPTLLFAGTSLFYYSAFMPGYSHAISFALIAGWLGSSLKLLRKPGWRRFAGNGVLLGLIVAVRPTNALIVLWPLFWNVYSISAFGDRVAWGLKHLGGVLLAAGIVAALFVPQFVYWHYATGTWGFAAYPGEGFPYWSWPRIGPVLGHVRNGLLVYAPVLMFALYGIVHGLRRRDPYAPASLACFLAFTYLFASWWAWWFGGAFGHRAYIDILPVLALPLGHGLVSLREHSRWSARLTMTLVVLFTAYTFLLTYQYEPPWDGPDWDREAWWDKVKQIWGG